MPRRVTPWPRVAWLLPTLSAAALLACNKTELDQDGDGFTELTGDCDDLDANVHPDALEVCENGIDDNCNGVEDEEGATSGRVWYLDLDGDGYGNETITLEACAQPDGFAAERWDCDEDRAEIHPGAVEVCDALDNDCDGQIDETTSADAMTWYADGDGDGYGDDDRAFVSCEPPGEGWISTGGDCADGDPLVSPEQTESCLTPYDDNCDGVVSSEDAFGCTDWYADLDGDGHAGTAACLCAPEAPWTATEATDCDDTRADIYPGSPTEDLGWSDGNCDGRVDRALAEADARFELGYAGGDSRFPNHAIAWSGGDMNGDGHDDLAVATASYPGGPGAVLVASGADLASQHALMETATAILPTSDEARTGWTKIVRISGFQPHLVDLNEDGLADLVVATEVHDGSTNLYEVSAYLGPLSGSLDGVPPDGTLTVPKVFDHHYSRNLRRAGDDSSGRPLLSLADRYAEDPFLGVYVGEVTRFGWDDAEGGLSVHSTTRGANTRQYIGLDVGDVGDINGDGVADHAIATNMQVTSDPYGRHTSDYGGSIDLYSDESGEPASMIVSNSGYRNIVEHLGGPGDLDGDGHADLVFSAWDSDLGAHEAGRVQVVWGPIPTGVHELSALDLLVIRGDVDYAHVECPAVIADADGDGRDDLAIGSDAEVAPGLSGRTYLWTGERIEGHLVAGDGMVVLEDARVDSPQEHGLCSQTWLAASSPGDVNNDGLGDLLLRGGVSEADDPEQIDSLFLFLGAAR